jgi:hypothetical protein
VRIFILRVLISVGFTIATNQPLEAQALSRVARFGGATNSYAIPSAETLGERDLIGESFRKLSAPATHWQTGAVVGAVVGIVFANLVMDEEASAVRRIGLSIVSGAVVAMPGALVGGLFPKDR